MGLEREIELIKSASVDIRDEQDMVAFLDHCTIVSMLVERVARELGEPEEFCRQLRVAGMLHDIGKLRVATYIYGKSPDRLHVSRLRYVRMHPMLGIDMLREAGDYSDELISCIASHHENYDGTGYPQHLEGEEIPYGARILRICDSFAALVSNRSYRAAFSVEAAVDIMIHEVKNYDMKIFLAFLSVVHSDDFEEIGKSIARARRHTQFARRKSETT